LSVEVEELLLGCWAGNLQVLQEGIQVVFVGLLVVAQLEDCQHLEMVEDHRDLGNRSIRMAEVALVCR
jgi:hypothetical protein